MFTISYSPQDALLLEAGCRVASKVNGCPTTVTKDGEHLVYQDDEGIENRCKIVQTVKLGVADDNLHLAVNIGQADPPTRAGRQGHQEGAIFLSSAPQGNPGA